MQGIIDERSCSEGLTKASLRFDGDSWFKKRLSYTGMVTVVEVIAMVKEVGDARGRRACILLAPNQSLSFSGNLWVFISLVAVSLGISIAFALIGAWMVIPFALLEVVLLAVLFGYVYLEGTRREVIRISDDRVMLDSSRGNLGKPLYHAEFSRDSLSVLVRMGEIPSEPASLTFTGPEGCLEVGDFLTDEEKAALVDKLGCCGICARKEKGFQLREF
ncbi:DUF2244 domain-containing protein [Microbulbifer aggregans]|uniref:DUF2244 domain-containing protein n=1 Tax=Microbulbifer aggregans TaxID=1769779 RepID=UPI001CFDCF35|nr:DUF2244 domain-containing protein [Microbulbifer aggregans]